VSFESYCAKSHGWKEQFFHPLMYKMMEQTKAKELVEHKNDLLFRVVPKDEIFKLK